MHTEFIKWYLIIILLSVILYITAESKNKTIKEERIVNAFYSLIFAIVIGMCAFISVIAIKSSYSAVFVVLQILMLLTGLTHVYLMPQKLKWSSNISLNYKVVYTLSFTFLGIAIMLFILKQMHIPNIYLIVLSSTIWIFVPLAYIESYKIGLSIPKALYKKWHFSLVNHIEPPMDNAMSNTVIIAFKFTKSLTDNEVTTFRVKAPLDMELGRLFYFFINDYNERNPDKPIEAASQTDETYGWIFCQKKKWPSKSKVLDFDLTINENHIKEDDVITCKREG